MVQLFFLRRCPNGFNALNAIKALKVAPFFVIPSRLRRGISPFLS